VNAVDPKRRVSHIINMRKNILYFKVYANSRSISGPVLYSTSTGKKDKDD